LPLLRQHRRASYRGATRISCFGGRHAVRSIARESRSAGRRRTGARGTAGDEIGTDSTLGPLATSSPIAVAALTLSRIRTRTAVRPRAFERTFGNVTKSLVARDTQLGDTCIELRLGDDIPICTECFRCCPRHILDTQRDVDTPKVSRNYGVAFEEISTDRFGIR